MAKQRTAGTEITPTSHRRPSPAGNVVELRLADLVTAYLLDSKPASEPKRFRLDALKGGDSILGEVLLATLAVSAPPVLSVDSDGRRRVVYNAETIFALASHTPAESWMHTRIRCRVLPEASIPSPAREDLEAIFRFLIGTKTRKTTDPARRALRQIRLIQRERPSDVARSASVSARRNR